MKRLKLLVAAMAIFLGASAQSNLLIGDANGDGKVTMEDATLAAQAYLSAPPKQGFNFDAADVDGDGRITVADANAIVNKVLCRINGHEYVEIGGLKWATMNIGATTVAGSYTTCYGDYYAWGETVPRYLSVTRTSASEATFSWRNYSGYRGSPSFLEPELDSANDAATQAWGSEWRTPTFVEMRALVEACTGSDRAQRPTELTGPITQGGIYAIPADQTILPEYTGVAGRLFVDQKDITKRLFFPLAGYVSGTTMKNAGTYFETWSSSLDTSNEAYAYMMLANSVQTNPSNFAYRSEGLTVRAVSGSKLGTIPVVSITDDYHIANVKVGDNKVLHVVILPNNATNRAIEWISSDPSIATVSYHGGVSATFTALKPGSVTITCRAKDGSGVQTTMDIEVVQSYEYVEIGGLKWAVKNLGALSDKGDCNKTYGDYFSWGETTPRYNTSTITSWEQVKFSDWKAEYPNGYNDNPSAYSSAVLDTIYDAATKEIGEGWRTPTIDDFESLIHACGGEFGEIQVLKNEITGGGIYRLYVDQTILPEYAGTPGLLFVDENNINKRIFLPYQGEVLDSKSTHSAGKVAWYATAQFDTDANKPYVARFQSGSAEFRYADDVPLGIPVRAVKGVIKPTAISLDVNDIEITEGNSVEIVSGFTPQWVTDPRCSWVTSDASIVSVTPVNNVHRKGGSSATAEVKALKAGTATITCVSRVNPNLKATCEVTVKEPLFEEGGHAYVVMGGVTWSAMNVGATTIAGSYKTCVGDYYAFGETTPRYSDMYRDNDGYVHVESWKSGFAEGYAGGNGYDKDLDDDHDVAQKQWGSDWRMPTAGEVTKLINACLGYNEMQVNVTPLTGKITKGGIYHLDANQKFEADYTGVEGYLFVDKKDIRQKLFFPKSGSFDGVDYKTYDTYYAVNQSSPSSASMNGANCSGIIGMGVDNSSTLTRDLIKSVVGRVVRPVFMEEIHLNNNTTEILDNDTHEYVEIGGVKWATMNVGATTVAGNYSTAYGDHVAWGELTTRYERRTLASESEATFTWKVGKENGYMTTIGKYDVPTTLSKGQDYAAHCWGDNWRMPTDADFKALAKACTGNEREQYVPENLNAPVTQGGIYWLTASQTVEEDYTGVAGMLFVDRQDISKRVFFPAAGVIYYTEYVLGGQGAAYWTASSGNVWIDSYNAYKVNPFAMTIYQNDFTPATAKSVSEGAGFAVRPVVAEGAVYKPTVSTIKLISDVERGVEGGNVTFRTDTYPATALNYFEWTVSDPTIAQIDEIRYTQTVTVKCLRPGKVIITAKASDGSGVTGDYVLWVDGYSNGLRYVDLGLSAKWATQNIGAKHTLDAGELFAWGETTSRLTNFDWEHYKFCLSKAQEYDRPWLAIDKYQSTDGQTQFCEWYKYTKDGHRFIGDRLFQLQPVDDAATARYGSNWRMPTSNEMRELITYCRWSYVTIDGHDAYEVVSKVPGYEGNSIYILASDGFVLPLWTSTRTSGNTTSAEALVPWGIYKGGPTTKDVERYEGLSVRPVYNEKSYGLEAKGYEYVDLGLSVNWASANVGATSSEETGAYVSWGDHSEKYTYDIKTDRHVMQNTAGQTPNGYKKYQVDDKIYEGMWYNIHSLAFLGDGLTTLQPEDDFARLKMGGNWRMPTKLEFAELVEGCTHTVTVINGVSVDKFTSKVPGYEGRYIIIPRSGMKVGSTVKYHDPNAKDGKSMQLWTSTLSDQTPYATVFQSYAGSLYGLALTAQARYIGVPVRGVLPK